MLTNKIAICGPAQANFDASLCFYSFPVAELKWLRRGKVRCKCG